MQSSHTHDYISKDNHKENGNKTSIVWTILWSLRKPENTTKQMKCGINQNMTSDTEK